ncbi:hypothetical protein [Frigoribacterium sp. CG_9.8]|uniref:hypothetical protein n=1 Tax=Frigoribacterium sp. CG_9.8 TaxID=2787733 RepID=UPI0018CBC2FC|nr:hypothetical protein [Frigoribacterium sp. CG_9.8]MBG6106585.1 hypothetical protein [Frigoribacterium sp. CG_9.8]
MTTIPTHGGTPHPHQSPVILSVEHHDLTTPQPTTTDLTVTTTATISRETIREVLEDLGCPYDWASYVETSDPETTDHDTAITIGYWEDGEQRPPHLALKSGTTITPYKSRPDFTLTYTIKKLTWQQIADAIRDLSNGLITDYSYQVRAANDYLHDPDDADGDAETGDLIVQWAAFGELVFG